MFTPQFIGVSVGFFLIIVAIMGGGVEVKEIKIPRLSGWARFGSALLGAGLALASSGFSPGETQAVAYAPPTTNSAAAGATNQTAETAEPDPPANSQGAEPEPAPPPPPPPPPPAGYVTIIDRLGPGQEYERVVVYLNGQAVGRLAIDQGERVDRLRIPADNRPVRYHLEGTERGFQSAGLITHRLDGQGTITLRPGAVFEVSLAEQQADPDDDILQLDLFPAIAGADDADGGAGPGDRGE
ncbi:MAG: hypothetical protein QOI38_1163 [Sphingomonadales bacterium]|nr:hypothetical protein [Sphingomonadales bacterium]